MSKRIQTFNGCYFTEPSIFPKNWDNGGPMLLKSDWRIQFYFYDPNYANKKPYGKLCVVKGMNEYKTLKDRREVTKSLLSAEKEEMIRGYNPFTGSYMVDTTSKERVFHEHMNFIDAFRGALVKVEASKKHKDQIRFCINRIEQAAIKLGMNRIMISHLKRRDLKVIFEKCTLSPSYYNKFKAYTSTLFNELVEYECCDTNIVRDIRKKKVVKTIREVMSSEDFDCVMEYLRIQNYNFYRYARIFILSGGRSSELFSLKPENIDIDSQEYTVMIKKGKQYKFTKKVILEPALPFWRELLTIAKKGDYIFSKGLTPGPIQNNSKQITRRWSRWVKRTDNIKDENGNVLKITADFYSLKHLFLDSLPDDLAQRMASHTSYKTTAIYQVNKENREREMLKTIKVSI